MGPHTDSGSLAALLETVLLIHKHCLQNKGVNYRNENFKFAGSLIMCWYIFRFNRLRGRGEVGGSEAANFGLFVGFQRYLGLVMMIFVQEVSLLAAEPHRVDHLEGWVLE